MLDGAKNPRGSRMSCSIYRCNDVLRLEMAVLLVGFVDQLALPASSGTFSSVFWSFSLSPGPIIVLFLLYKDFNINGFFMEHFNDRVE